MKVVADLHIHSHYSRATSKNLTFEHLSRWAQLKGVNIVGSGDIAHPGWLQEMHDKLEPAEEGLFRLKDEFAEPIQETLFPACRNEVRFLLAGEISNIYKRHDAVRKVHNVVFAPTLDSVTQIQSALDKIGNIHSDGRPILGLDSRDLLEIILDIDPRCYLIPAHIWTPWFSMLGSKSGFDSVEACFGDLTSHIFAVETGLSSDPPMNWRVSDLDRYTLISSSDAHSPPKLAREATLFDIEPSYDALFAALHSGDPAHYLGTLEFFPEEGKYHLDGHRKCNLVWEPPATIAHNGICSVCGKKVTVGVMHRVEELADRPLGGKPARTYPFESLIPLPEILSEIHAVGVKSKRVERAYEHLLANLGPELAILRTLPLDEIAVVGGEPLAEGIARMRQGDVVAEGGYDGEYGVVKVFANEPSMPQLTLFTQDEDRREQEKQTRVDTSERTIPIAAVNESTPSYADNRVDASDAEAEQETDTPTTNKPTTNREIGGWTPLSFFEPAPDLAQPSQLTEMAWLARLNPEQRAAVEFEGDGLVIVAGPGTGKTRTLTVRIAYLIAQKGVLPENILAITFTNKAAEEMRERLTELVGEEVASRFTIKTFHAFGAFLLHEYHAALSLPEHFIIGDEKDRRALLKEVAPELRAQEIDRYLEAISTAKNRLLQPDSPLLVEVADEELPHLADLYTRYEMALQTANMVDFDDLILLPVRLLEEYSDVQEEVQDRYPWISVDEYQDVNLAQYQLLRLLTAGGANLCVIGDPDQAIYGFRGADRGYFLTFQEDYPNTQVLRLTRSYRSPQSLLDAAIQVISHAPERRALELWSDFVEQVRLDLYQAPTDRAEAEYVVHRIEQMVGGTSYFSLDSGRTDGVEPVSRSFGDFVVLYRLGAQSRLLVEAFERSGIPYQAYGQTPLSAHKEVQDVLTLLWLLYNPAARLHWTQLLLTVNDTPPSSASLEPLWTIMEANDATLLEIVEKASTLATFSRSQRERLTSLAMFLTEWVTAEPRPVVDLITQAHAFWVEIDGPDADAEQRERIERLRLRAVSYGENLGDFLEAMALQSETDAYDPRSDRVTLMTLHAAKGLEFPVVFIVGCEEGLLPYIPQSEKRQADIEEERRLFYVGMTRAQEKLILTHAKRRFLYGQRTEPSPSRFVDDIENALKEIQQAIPRPSKKEQPEDLQLKLF